jgi:hypothetical protein
MFTRTIFIRPDSELVQESVCACAKLFVDEESTWYNSNLGIEQNIDGFYTKDTKRRIQQALCKN